MEDYDERDFAFLDILGLGTMPTPRKRTHDQLDLAFLDLLDGSDETIHRKKRRLDQEEEEDTYQRVTRNNLQHREITTPRPAEESEAPISERELEAMRKHTHDIATSSLIKKVTPDKQRKKPPRRCDHFSVTDSIEATLTPRETSMLEVFPRAPVVAEDYRRKGGYDGGMTPTSTADPRKTYLENDILLDGAVMTAITDADMEDAEDVEMIEAVTRVPKRADKLLPLAERATLHRARCKDIIVRSQSEQDRRVAAAREWITRDNADAQHIKQLMRTALYTHARSDGIRMHRVRYEPASGRRGEEVRPLPFHISSFAPPDRRNLATKVMLPREFEETILLRAAIPQLQERPCTNGITCQGHIIFLDAHFQLREFVTPDEYQAFRTTGKWPHVLEEEARPCLLCMRHIINTAFYSAIGAGQYMDNSSYPLGNICNYVDRPGEYSSDDCISNNLTHAGLVGYLVRHNYRKYSTQLRRVKMPDCSVVEVLFVVQHGMATIPTGEGKTEHRLHFQRGPP